VAAEGGTCTINIVFTPTATGAVTDQISIADNAANSPQIASLSGNGILGPVVVAPPALSFGVVKVGASSQKSFAITNKNSVALTISSIVSTGSDFTPSSTCVGVLNAGGTCNVEVTFAPAAGARARRGSIQIYDNAAKSPQLVRVTGTASQ
jgi:hypothetical protein